MMESPKPARAALPFGLLLSVALGTMLNPLNSSMIAVALVPIQTAFQTSIADATWLISAFYLAGSVGQPLMGRLGDQFGPRRVFLAGLVVAGVTGALAPFAPALGWLIALRVLQAFGTSAGFPSGMAIFRRRVGPGGTVPAGALAVISVAGNVSAALGPTLGGVLVQFAGWPAIFLVNVPAAAIGIAMALRMLPADPPTAAAARAGSLLATIDLPGLALFSVALVGLLAFLLSLSSGPRWFLLPLAPLAAGLLVWRELRAPSPFLDVRMLAPGRGLAGVYAQFVVVNLVFYGVFFSLPLWLERVRGVEPGLAGLIVTPLAGFGVVATVVAARMIRRWGPLPPLILGAAALCLGVVLVLALGPTTPVPVVLLIVSVLGVPNGFLNMSLQSLLFAAASGAEMGAASGLFQTCRYIGSVLSTSLIGLVFASSVTSSGLHAMAAGLAVVSALLLGASLLRLPGAHRPLPGRAPS
jgi:MFS family permease